MSYENKKMEYEGKQLLAKKTNEFLEEALEDMKESTKIQHQKDVENFNKIKEETKQRHLNATKNRPHKVDVQAQIEKAKALGKVNR